ncbi:MAG: DUF4384 domain-containing protein [Salinivirgaceae bacterium]|jgi:hypothetical protein|nr:DUF4384 domain-containing protein [Salinivirgaceae bacterium]
MIITKKNHTSHINQQLLLFAFALILLLLSTSSSFADNKTIKVKNIKGQAIGGVNASPASIIDQAIKNAKLIALSEAGIHEEISAYQNLYKSETDENYEEVFMSDIFTSVSGVVSNINVRDTVAHFDPKTFTLKVSVTIDATVIKYDKKEDRTFDAWVEGIKAFYQNNSIISFTVKPTQDCYARIFLIAKNQESYVLFPNDHESDIKLQANTEQTFPTEELDYWLDTEIDKEPHRIIIVLLKKPIPYTNKVAYKPILDWIMSISPETRVVKTFGFIVAKD